MKEKPLVSIIVPVYNASQFLTRCIESILSQGTCRFELVLVDDGSTDASSKICDKYINDNRCSVFVIHKENQGVTEARIDGFNISTGNYVMFVDADDYLSPDTLNIMYDTAMFNNADLVVMQNNIIDDISIKEFKRTARKGLYSRKDIDDLLHSTFLFDKNDNKSGFPLYLWGKLYRRAILEGILEKPKGFWYGEDIICMMAIMNRINSMYILNTHLYNYTIHRGQVTKKSIDNLWPQYVRVWDYINKNDINNYFDRQLPERIWFFCYSSLWSNAMKSSLKNFAETYNIIRKPNIVKQLVLDRNSTIQGLTNNMFKFFMRNGWCWIHYVFLRYRIIRKINRVLKFWK